MHLPLYTLWCIVHCININRMSHKRSVFGWVLFL